jgi:NAD(P)H dehydrogenase (quinone)
MTYGVSLGNSQLGRLAIASLCEKGVAPGDIVAVVRTPAKAKDLALHGVVVRQGEYGNDPSLVSAFRGVDRLYMISGMAGLEERIRQHRGCIEAAREAGVSHVAYTSFIDVAEDSPFYPSRINKDTEACLKETGFGFTVLRNGMYVEADLDYISEYVKAGRIANSIGDGRISYISRRDLALAGAHCLLDEGHAGRTYTLTGPEAVTQSQLAQWISTWTGQTIPYEALSDDEYRRSFPNAQWADVIVALYASVRLGNAEVVTEDFERIAGRPAYSVPEVHERFY